MHRIHRRFVAALAFVTLFAAHRTAHASAGPPEAFWTFDDTAPLGFTNGIYNGPTYFTSFHMNGNTDGVSIGNGNAVSYLFGYAKPASGKKLSIWLTIGSNTSINIASAVGVSTKGTWELYLNPAQSAVSPGGSVTVLRFLVCEYVAGTPGVNPYDKTTLWCGPWGSGSHSTNYDIFNSGLVVQKQNNNQDRMTRGTLYTTQSSLWVVRSWVFDGPSTPQDPEGFPDVASTNQDWGINPPDNAVTTYMVDKGCTGGGGSVWCDPAPAIKVNGYLDHQGAEFQWVYGGMFGAAPNRNTIVMAAAYRDEFTLQPTIFEGLFDQPIQINIGGGSGGCAVGSETAPTWLAPIGLLLGTSFLARRARRPARG